MHQASTLEELAAQIGIDGKALAQEVEHYNQMVEAGEDADFARKSEQLSKIEGSYTAIEFWVTQTFSSGGLKINDQCQVLKIASAASDVPYEPIGRLYAGGDMAPYDCHGGYGVSKAFSCGRVAGQQAAALEPWS